MNTGYDGTSCDSFKHKHTTSDFSVESHTHQGCQGGDEETRPPNVAVNFIILAKPINSADYIVKTEMAKLMQVEIQPLIDEINAIVETDNENKGNLSAINKDLYLTNALASSTVIDMMNFNITLSS